MASGGRGVRNRGSGRICTRLLASALLMSAAQAVHSAAYVDLSYDAAESVLPQEQPWLKRLFKNDERKVFLVASVLKRNVSDSTELLVAPPTVLESFDRSDKELKRDVSENLDLLRAHFVNDSEQLILRVEFFSVRSGQARTFSDSLLSMATAYYAAGSTAIASKVATSAMSAIGSILFESRELYLTYNGGIDLDPASAELRLYFDDQGNINDTTANPGTVSSQVVFHLNTEADIAVDFDFAFANQPVNQREKVAYQALLKAGSPSDRRDACRALRQELRARFSASTVDDLVAIAVNDLGWAQDDTEYYCIAREQAVRYKRQHGLDELANCSSDDCVKTKTLLFLLDGGAQAAQLQQIAGADLDQYNCKTDTGYSKLFRWSDIRSSLASDGFNAFTVESCLLTPSGVDQYTHTFSWVGGKLASHGCDVSSRNYNCE